MEKETVQTYRAALQDLIRQSWELCDRAGVLRDSATLEEKKYWNEYRGKMYDAIQPLHRLDNSMPDNIANRKI